jgi:osmotically-inducible protein OsmY
MRTCFKTLVFSLLPFRILASFASPSALDKQNQNTNIMRLFIRFFPLLLLAFLLIDAPLPAQDAAAKLKTRITIALERSYATSAFKIAVTNPGHVVIDGEVPSYWDKQNAFVIVVRVPGVKEITNRLSVQTAFVPDAIIKVELEEYFKRMRAIKDPGKILVGVSGAVVFFRGTANFPHEKALAEEIAAWHRGVKEVDNQIEVLSLNKAVSDAGLTHAIQNMLSCDFPFDEKTVQAKIMKGQVLLTGVVSRLWAKLEIEKAVQNTSGVRQVESRLEVMASEE